MAELTPEVQGFLNWLPSYLQTRGTRRSKPVTLDDLECPELRGLGFLTGAVAAYKRHLNPPPPPRPIEEVLTADDLALLKRQTDEVQGCVVETLQRMDPGPGRTLDSELVKATLEFIAGPQFKQ